MPKSSLPKIFPSFTLAVWKMATKIPRGRVMTYASLAKALNKPKAARAVGNALNKNPHWPKVPCHRVVCSDGRVGGFADGSGRKVKLLEKEGVRIEKGFIIPLKNFLYR